ncbi:hypothetical protein IRJ34_07305 [Paenarthrobacter sp. GOM3]|uniref:hypothetical protein n=1 Tax=Paenarthrobacter sp. GOM3 TaxID=2782567 RepID=UPI001BA86DC9|nr:hypothetical protein [Paenarthrobacter sp. GOM3]WOH20123.1 hypothetical protein IRJ34_07305 [Paenarthrobacter sp. GOM3]
MSDDLLIVIGGLQLFGRPGVGPLTVVKDGLDGWDDRVPLRGEQKAHPQGPGSYVLPRYPESRSVNITGKVLAQSIPEREREGLQLTGLGADGSLQRIEVTKGGLTQWADAHVDDVDVDPIHGTTNSDYQLTLWCPDPLKYGNTEQYVTTQAAEIGGIINRGNYPATPSLRVQGTSALGYTVYVMGQPFQVTQPLWFASPHEIDYADGRLRINGVVIHHGLGLTYTPTIPPNTESLLSVTPASAGGTATVTLTLTDTYI